MFSILVIYKLNIRKIQIHGVARNPLGFVEEFYWANIKQYFRFMYFS